MYIANTAETVLFFLRILDFIEKSRKHSVRLSHLFSAPKTSHGAGPMQKWMANVEHATTSPCTNVTTRQQYSGLQFRSICKVGSLNSPTPISHIHNQKCCLLSSKYKWKVKKQKIVKIMRRGNLIESLQDPNLLTTLVRE